MKCLTWVPDALQGWARSAHVSALVAPRGFEKPMVAMLDGWLSYACRHSVRYGAPIGEDGVLGPEWAAIGAALRGLLNGELGRLDAGTLDTIICDNLRGQGFDPDAL